ncbi:MAG: GntR family transcriptional regulator [Clostridia bacterium]
MEPLKPIRLLPARERVTSALRKAILSRNFEEGQELTLESVASQLGVSSTPVREAFQMLATEGMILLRPNKGAVVKGISRKFLEDHYAVRAVLEGAAIALTCRSNADISEIIDVYEQGKIVVAERRFDEYSNCNQAFHMAIWMAADNAKLLTMLSNLWNGLSQGRTVTEEQYVILSASEHDELIKYIINRDEKGAQACMEEHIHRSLRSMLEGFE